MEFKGTKGKWLIEESGLTEMQYDIDTNDNSTLIARVGTIDDAQLIASAPELLEASKMMLEYLETDNMKDLDLNFVRLAINKALGK